MIYSNIALSFGWTLPLICDIIKSLQSKESMDSDGLSSKLLKEIKHEICIPIAHVFNLSDSDSGNKK
jgi:hypothetical protein